MTKKNIFALICEIKPTISGKPELYSPLYCHACVWLTSPSWPVASSSFLWLSASKETSSSLSTRSLTASPTSVCLAVYFLQLPLHMKDTRFLLFFIRILLFTSSFIKAVCLAHNYNYRNARIGHTSLLLRYICPVLLLAILLNIPKVIVISPLGDALKDNFLFWKIFFLYQVNYVMNRSYWLSESNYFVKILHPVTSTVIAPLLVLILLNIKTFKKLPISQNLQSTNDRSRKAARWVI